MDVFEAVDSRIACRHFLDKPVDPGLVKDLIERAARAASGGNLQSWNIYALTGQPLAQFKAIVQQRIAREDPRHLKSEYPIYPDPMFGTYKERREAHGVQLYGSLGIDQTDAAARLRRPLQPAGYFPDAYQSRGAAALSRAQRSGGAGRARNRSAALPAAST